MNTAVAAVHTTSHGDIIVASLAGEVDLSNASSVRAQLLASIPNRASGLVLDLAETVYLDSQGIQLLLDLTELLGVRRQRIRLAVPEHALIRRVLSLTSIAKALSIDPTVVEAVAQLRAQDS